METAALNQEVRLLRESGVALKASNATTLNWALLNNRLACNVSGRGHV
jgi:hypothetical protein